MAPEPQSDAGPVTSEQSATSPRPRRGRRGGRGHRGRGRRGPQAPISQASPPADEAAAPGQPIADHLSEAPDAPASLPDESEASEAVGSDAGAAEVESRGGRREPRSERPLPPERETPPPPPRERRPASPMAVQEAIEEVTHIIETLRATLDDMEEVLETLELAERQKTADEQEIETLRRGLRRLHQPSHHQPRSGGSEERR